MLGGRELPFCLVVCNDSYPLPSPTLLFQLLVEVLLDHSNFKVMMRYICDKANLKLMMNLLRDPSPNIRLEAFHLFKVCHIYATLCVLVDDEGHAIDSFIIYRYPSSWCIVWG